MSLTAERISELAGGKGVKRISVYNFLVSLGSLTAVEAFGNLDLDARLYGWNGETRTAIAKGISEHFATRG